MAAAAILIPTGSHAWPLTVLPDVCIDWQFKDSPSNSIYHCTSAETFGCLDQIIEAGEKFRGCVDDPEDWDLYLTLVTQSGCCHTAELDCRLGNNNCAIWFDRTGIESLHVFVGDNEAGLGCIEVSLDLTC